MKKMIFVLVSISIVSCIKSRQTIITSEVEIGKKMSFEDLKQSEQIIKEDHGYIILRDVSNNLDVYLPYLFFCDTSFTVLETAYYCSEYIDSISNDTVFGLLNKQRKSKGDFFNKKSLSRKIHYTNNEKFNGYQKIQRTIIDSLELNVAEFCMTLYVRESDDLFGWKDIDHVKNNLEVYKEKFSKRRTITVSFSSLKFSKYHPHSIYLLKTSKNKRIWDEMIVIDSTKIDMVFEKIYGIK